MLLLATTVEYLPAVQLEQDDAPAALLYWPAAQALQFAVPRMFLNLPAVQAVQSYNIPNRPHPPAIVVDKLGPVYPTLQTASVAPLLLH